MAASEPLVIGVVLRVDVRGWTAAPPLLPKEPIRTSDGRDGARTFFYDLSPKEADLSVTDLCHRLGSRLDRMLTGEKAPFQDGMFAVRLGLDIGLSVDPKATSWAATFPPEFLAVLADAQVELTATYYPATDADEPLSEDDL